MTETVAAIPVRRTLRWEKSEEKYVLLHLETLAGEEVLAMDEASLFNLMRGVIDASGAFPQPMGATGDIRVLSGEHFDLHKGKNGAVAITFFTENNGHVSFGLSKNNAERLHEWLTAALRFSDRQG